MGRFDHGAMACIMPFKGTYSLLREYGARKARLALGRAVAVVHTLLLVPQQIRYTYTYWGKLQRSGDLRLTDRMAYCHGYPSLASFILRRKWFIVGSRGGAKMPHVSQAITT
jgi:hypothetical protein